MLLPIRGTKRRNPPVTPKPGGAADRSSVASGRLLPPGVVKAVKHKRAWGNTRNQCGYSGSTASAQRRLIATTPWSVG